jgi:polysaccharide pyruvyl transferase WcaK-like protein
MNVIITGGGFANKGAEAMLLATADAIRKRLPGANLFAHVNDEDANAALAAGLRPTKPPLFRHAWAKPFKHLVNAARFRSVDCVLDVGGYQFGDVWGPESARRKARILRSIIPAAATVVYLPQAWGPFENAALVEPVKEIVARANLCYARDDVSMTWLKRIAGEEATNVRLGTDVAWTFKGLSRDEGRRLLDQCGAAMNGRPLIALTPNFGMAKRAGADWTVANPYMRMLRDIAETLIDQGATVLLIGHFYTADPAQDDRHVCSQLAELLPSTAPVVVARSSYSAGEIKAILSNCNAVVSSRYHALIAALSQGIPALALGWSHKYEALLAEIGTPESCIQMDDDRPTVSAKLRDALTSGQAIRERIRTSAAALAASADAQFDEVASMVAAAGKQAAGNRTP